MVAVLMPVACLAQSAPAPLHKPSKWRSYTELYTEQRRVVLGYCREDFNGARLSANGFERIKPFVSYRENPEFTHFTVATRFDVPIPEQPSDYLAVTYKVLGEWENGVGWLPKSSTRSVVFALVDRDGMLINEVTPPVPNVSVRAALAYLRQQLAAAKTDSDRALVQKGIDALTAELNASKAAASAPAEKP